MENQPHNLEVTNKSNELISFQAELRTRLDEVSGVDPNLVAAILNYSDSTWNNLNEIVNDPNSISNLDITASSSQFDAEQRLLRLSHIKANLVEDNIVIQKDKHNITLENYIKLALQTSSDLSTLRIFSEIVRAKLKTEDNNQFLAKQALLIWAPAAEIAGWHELRTELEDIAFARLYHQEKQKISETYAHLGGDRELTKLIEEYSGGLKTILQDEIDNDINIAVSGRKKAYFSVWRKAIKNESEDFMLPDFVGIRIVIDNDAKENTKAIEICYAVADILTQCFSPVPDRYKDYIARPKANGYQSLHLTIQDINGAFVEFQVRTENMHNKAEYDPNASHMKYDATEKITPGRYFRKLDKPHKIYAWRDAYATAIRDRKANGNLSLEDLEPSKVFVFSSDNNLYHLVEGNTALDFAFAVHSDSALRLKEILINGKQINFSYPLSSGDVVELKYSQDKIPTWGDSWFLKVNSRSALKRLHKARRTREAAHYIKLAELKVEEYFSGNKEIINMLSDDQKDLLARKYGVTNFEGVLKGIGAGALKIGKLIYNIEKYIDTEQKQQLENHRIRTRTRPKNLKSYKDDLGKIFDIAVLQTLYCHHHVAGCCPIKVGEDIVAVPSRLRGDFAIHKPNCVNLPSDNRRALPCTWLQRV